MYVGWSESGDGIETKWRISPAEVPIYKLPSGRGQNVWQERCFLKARLTPGIDASYIDIVLFFPVG
jgi:hypothetical protein